MSFVPLLALSVFLLPFLAAHLVRALLPAAAARLAGHVFRAVSWSAGGACAVLGAWTFHVTAQNPSVWGQLGLLGLIGYLMLGSALWTAFHLAYRVLVPADRFRRYAGRPVNIPGWPLA